MSSRDEDHTAPHINPYYMSGEDLNLSGGFSQFERLGLARVALTSSGDHDVDNGGAVNGQESRPLPIANVGRIMRDALPPEAKISKRAKETIQECATEFISFVTGEASERCRRERRKTVNGDDICHAMKTLGLDHYAGAMHRYLQMYRDSEELAASLNSRIRSPPEIQIDVRDELSVSRAGNEKKHGRN